MNATYKSSGGRTARVVGNNLLVRPDPAAEKTSGGIFYPGVGPNNMHGTGTVVAVGYLTGEHARLRTPIPGIAPGDRILYVRHLEMTDANPQIKRILDENVIRIRAADVLLLLDGEDAKRLG